jgi:PAS domain S-box-containing protein
MPRLADHIDDQVLVLAPTAGDGAVAASMIESLGADARVCSSMSDLCGRLENGAAALVIASEALDTETGPLLAEYLERQPAWSDVPVILLTLATLDELPEPIVAIAEAVGNITMLERPFKFATFQSVVKMALRARRRQYEVGRLLASESEAKARADWETQRADSRERELRMSEERFRLIANSIPQPAWMAQPDGQMFWFNERWYDFVAAAPQKSGAQTWLDAQDPAYLPDVMQRWQHSLATGAPFDMEFPLRRHDGRYRWFLTRAAPLLDPDGRPKLWFGTSTDISELRATAQALRQSEERLLLAVQTAQLGLWNLDVLRRRFDCSDTFKSMLGVPATEPINYAGFWQSIHAEDRSTVTERIELAMVRGELFEAEYRTVWRDGSAHWLVARARPVFDDDGALAHLLGVALDITDLKLNEQRREIALSAERAARTQAERVGRMKDEFLATLSHELRTPLNAVLGWAEVLQRTGPDSRDFERGIGAITRNARLQAQLIEDLLDTSRIVSGGLQLDTEEIELNEVVQAAAESIQPAANERGVHLTRLPGPAALVRGDKRRLQQVIWNLLSNAVKFTPKGGDVTIGVEADEARARIIVADAGQGIDVEFLPHLFERFRQEDSSRTRRQGGLGLGLSIVKQLVEMHFGEVSGASDGPGKGSIFTVTLPRLRAGKRTAETARARGSTDPAFSALRGARILAVDDERDSRELIARVLADPGAQVLLADSAALALELLQREDPDLIISDIGMPGTDGFELMQRIRHLPADRGGRTPAIALTAFARAEDRDLALRCGFQRHLVKPLNALELLSACSELLAERDADALTALN